MPSLLWQFGSVSLHRRWLEMMINLGRDLVEKQHALREKHCNSAISLFDANPHLVDDLEDTGSYIQGTKYCDLPITIASFPKLHAFMVKQIENTLQEYTEFLNIDGKIGSGIERIAIMKFFPSKGNFQHHFDAQAKYYNRRLAIIWYLNDVKEGGELNYPTSSQPITISPELGKAVITPCDWTHSHFVAPPLTNARYSIIAFITH